MLMTRVKRQI